MSTDQNSSTCSPPFAGRSQVVDFQNAPFPTHDPFVLRKVLVLLAAFPAAVVGFLGESLFVSLSLYFVLVTLADLVSHYALALKPSQNVDPEKLLFFQCVTPEQFDAYFDTRRWIRCGSLGTALLAVGLSFVFAPVLCLKVFCVSYVLATWIGIGYVRFLGILRPKLFRRDDSILARYQNSPKPGHITSAQWALNKVTGFPFYGPIDHSS